MRADLAITVTVTVAAATVEEWEELFSLLEHKEGERDQGYFREWEGCGRTGV